MADRASVKKKEETEGNRATVKKKVTDHVDVPVDLGDLDGLDYGYSHHVFLVSLISKYFRGKISHNKFCQCCTIASIWSFTKYLFKASVCLRIFWVSFKYESILILIQRDKAEKVFDGMLGTEHIQKQFPSVKRVIDQAPVRAAAEAAATKKTGKSAPKAARKRWSKIFIVIRSWSFPNIFSMQCVSILIDTLHSIWYQ